MTNKNKLMEILLDKSAEEAEKDDAAIQLADYDDDDVIDFLYRITIDDKYDEMIRASCGESLANIWIRNNNIDYDKLSGLKGVALTEVKLLIKEQRKDWYTKYFKG